MYYPSLFLPTSKNEMETSSNKEDEGKNCFLLASGKERGINALAMVDTGVYLFTCSHGSPI